MEKVLFLQESYPKDCDMLNLKNRETYFACANIPDDVVMLGNGIRLPRTRFHINTLLRRLPLGWTPDLIFVSSSLKNLENPPIPMGFNNIDIPSILKMHDTQHTLRPISSAIEYALDLGCRYHMTINNRRHLHFFRGAGLPNVFWIPPALHTPYVQVKSPSSKQYDILFCGGLSNLHPYRKTVIKYLKDSGVDISTKKLPYLRTLEAYSQSKIVLNVSLNGDLNRRVFEALMAGAFLITDRIAQESGLPLLFHDGVHLDSFGSKEELLEKVRFYLNHPDIAASIAQNGHKLFVDRYLPDRMWDQLFKIVVGGERVPDEYSALEDIRFPSHNMDTFAGFDKVVYRTRIYELIQDLHRSKESIRIVYRPEIENFIVSDLIDLPRAEISQIISLDDFNGIFDVDVFISTIFNNLLSLNEFANNLCHRILRGGLLMLICSSASNEFDIQEADRVFFSKGFIREECIEFWDKKCFVYRKKMVRLPIRQGLAKLIKKLIRDFILHVKDSM